MKHQPPPTEITVSLGALHCGQIAAHNALRNHRFKALRCGRRFGKTELAKTWIGEGLVRGWECAWFAPQNKLWQEVYHELSDRFLPLRDAGSKGSGVLRFRTGSRLDFWSLENGIAGRGRRYRRLVIDEAAFAKDGDVRTAGSTMDLWEKAIKPTLYDYGGEALVCSNSAGKNPDNFFYNICVDQKYGFAEFHATTADNPLLPKRLAGESELDWRARREAYQADLKANNDPLVYAQEYCAEFVDWSGVAFFSREKMLDEGRPVSFPHNCDCVFAVIDTASKTGTQHDGTAVTYFARNQYNARFPLTILDWDIIQIEGDLLEAWLPTVFSRLEELARTCRARHGSLGAWIEDKNSGTVLLQSALRRRMPVHAIESKLTAMGKDERAIAASPYVYRGLVKYSDHAFNKSAIYKQKARNHLLEQIESYRVGAKDDKREDDLLDTFCYGISIALGNDKGF